MDYKIHGNTVFIRGNGLIGHYLVSGDKVYKFRQLRNGDEVAEDFHTIGDLPLNTEAKLLNELRDRAEV